MFELRFAQKADGVASCCDVAAGIVSPRVHLHVKLHVKLHSGWELNVWLNIVGLPGNGNIIVVEALLVDVQSCTIYHQ